MIRHPLRYMLAAALALSGCGALLDVKDIYLDPNATSTGTDGGNGGETGTNVEGGAVDGGGDSATCMADVTTDTNNCGRCGHSCLGGACTAGVCQAVQLGGVADAPLTYVVASDQYVFVSTSIRFTTQVGGLWRRAKAGGAMELYANIRYAEDMAVLGDKLYFVSDDTAADGMTNTGGLYSCPLAGPAPCAPALVAAGTDCRGLTVDQNKVFYGDGASGKGLMVYAPPAAPTVLRSGFGFSGNAAVDGNSTFYSAVIFAAPQRAKVFESFADGGVTELYAYENPNAQDGQLIVDKGNLLFTAYDDTATTGGVVRRIARAGGAPCDLGGMGNKRPYGVYADAANVYWSNQGEGADAPYTNGSIVSCEQAGCCTTPKVLWTAPDAEPRGVAGDATAIYFVTHAKGSLWKIAKP